jgi:hypothetical protein
VGEQEFFQTKGPDIVMVIASVRRTGICQEQGTVWYSLCNNIPAPNRQCIRPTAAVIPITINSFLTAPFSVTPCACCLSVTAGLIALNECWFVSKKDGNGCKYLKFEE